MKALFLVVSPHTENLPPEQDTDGATGIYYLDASGNLAGGWWIAPETEAPMPNTTAVVINSTDAKLDEFAQLPNLFFLKDLPDENQTPEA